MYPTWDWCFSTTTMHSWSNEMYRGLHRVTASLEISPGQHIVLSETLAIREYGTNDYCHLSPGAKGWFLLQLHTTIYFSKGVIYWISPKIYMWVHCPLFGNTHTNACNLCLFVFSFRRDFMAFENREPTLKWRLIT